MVVIEKCQDYDINNIRKTLENVFEKMGGINKYIKPGMKVLLKPNLVMKKNPQDAATTHPSIVRELSLMIKEAGGRVVIADSPGGMYTQRLLKNVYTVCQMENAAGESGAELNFDLSQVDIDNPNGKYLKRITVIKPLIDADLVINLPKLKTHGQMVYTGAVKNLFGAIPGVLKAEYHFRMAEYEDFADALIDIFLSVKPALNIMDAVIGMDGHGPTGGNPKKIGLVLAGEDGFEIDYTALRIVNADPMDIPIIRQAVKRNLCPEELKNIKIIGEKVDDIMVSNFEMPQLTNLKSIEFFDRGILKHLVKRLKPKPYFSPELCIGCMECEKNCPAGIVKMENNKPRVELSKCIRCFCCQELCPAKAIEIKRPFIAKLLVKK